MKEILFRGKRVDNTEWAYGDISHHKSGKVFIKTGSATHSFQVGASTVGQYTGLTDMNGHKIFDGDIVEHTAYPDENIRVGYVEYVDKYGAFFIKGSGYSDNQMYAFFNFKVIGNIYDNPELLEGGEDIATEEERI